MENEARDDGGEILRASGEGARVLLLRAASVCVATRMIVTIAIYITVFPRVSSCAAVLWVLFLTMPRHTRGR